MPENHSNRKWDVGGNCGLLFGLGQGEGIACGLNGCDFLGYTPDDAWSFRICVGYELRAL
jgi:hypothetical protein